MTDFAITRFEFKRDRVIGDSQVGFDRFHGFALEIKDGAGRVGLGFGHALWDAMPALAQLESTFADNVWPMLDGQAPQTLLHRVSRPRGGNQRDATYDFGEAMQIALWDLAAQQAGLPLADYLGGQRRAVRAYASGLEFHLSDTDFCAFFQDAADVGFTTFKIKLGHADPQWDLHRLELLRKTVGADAGIMIDANEAWSPKQALMRLDMFRRAGFDLIWVEDPILRSDFAGLRALCSAEPWTQINSGEYLDVAGRADLLMSRSCDIINLHGRISEVMRIGWLASEIGLPVALGNTTLETGVHAACALPEAAWMEFAFQNYDHLVDTPVEMRDGFAHVSDRPGLGFALSDDARRLWSAPDPLHETALKTGPVCAPLAALRTQAAAEKTSSNLEEMTQ
ncbi:mandelate racemase/muconate lactonizing enzyme family protein [Yoonia tamlensis]|nr:enolase C-terminal domain-like protein [Yoonia tamlensis]